jgi:hypothetical protein
LAGAAFSVALVWVGACDDNGALVCPAGAALCGTQCSNVQGDPDNCGACGNVCAHGSICDLGQCTSAGFDAGLVEDAAAGPADAARETTGDRSSDGAATGAGDAVSDAPHDVAFLAEGDAANVNDTGDTGP